MNPLHDFLLILVPLFAVIDPPGTLPIYLGLTAHYTDAQRRIIVKRAVVVAGIVAVLFVVLGQAVFAFLGVQFADFQIAGGLLVVILAIVDLLSTGKPAVSNPAEMSADEMATLGVVPLGIPLMVGPATMTTSLLLVNTYADRYNAYFHAPYGQFIVMGMVCLALAVNLALLFAVLWYSVYIVRLVGKSTLAVANKIVMILLAAVAVSLIRQGIVSIVTGVHAAHAGLN